MKTICSNNHQINSYECNKVFVSCFDDKRFLLNDGIQSLSYGHVNIMQNNNMNTEMSDIKLKLKNHLKNFTVKELKHEVKLIKSDFQVSKFKREQVVEVILNNCQLFKHLLIKNKVKKTIKPKTNTKNIKLTQNQKLIIDFIENNF